MSSVSIEDEIMEIIREFGDRVNKGQSDQFQYFLRH